MPISKLSPEAREKLKTRVRSTLPSGPIAYEAFANAAKGRVPA